jgi:hypothetical protein
MASLTVVEDLDVLEEGRPRLDARGECVPGEQFARQGGEEALHHSVVVTVPHGAYRAADAHVSAALAEYERGILAAVVARLSQGRGDRFRSAARAV